MSNRLNRTENKVKRRLSIAAASWKPLIIPSLLIIGLLFLLKASGALQTPELEALDLLSRHCRAYEMAAQVTIVGIDEEDYRALGGFPLSDQVMAQAIETLSAAQPQAVGLDIFRDMPVGEGQAALSRVMRATPNLIAIEVALNELDRLNVAPPADIDASQVGFADVIVDEDGRLRRVPLVARDWDGNLKYSLPLQLARLSLESDGISLKDRSLSSEPVVFSKGESVVADLPKFQSHSGGYVRADANGTQMLVNFCRLAHPYDVVSFRDVVAGTVSSDLIRNRVILIGTVASSIKDNFITGAVQETLYSAQVAGRSAPNQLIYGVEVHAYVVAQIVHSVMHRPLIFFSLPEIAEYLLIAIGGLAGIAISVFLQSPWKSIISLSVLLLGWVGLSYLALLYNVWLPLVPVGMAFYGAGLTAAFFDRDVRFELEQRQKVVDLTYGAVHNGPLQQIAAILRSLDDSATGHSEATESDALRQRLQLLNDEMRSIFEHMRQNATDDSNSLYLSDSTILDLQQPMPYLLYQVYEYTLRQPMPGFATLKSCIPPDFECLGERYFRTDQKRGLCLFLQEALINIGKHAVEANVLEVDCYMEDRLYRLKVLDDGIIRTKGSKRNPMKMRDGSKQAMALARSLKGAFRRYLREEKGVVCELIWPVDP